MAPLGYDVQVACARSDAAASLPTASARSVHGSIMAMRVGVDLGVSHELVRVVADGVGVLGGHGGRGGRCGDGRGSGGKILRP